MTNADRIRELIAEVEILEKELDLHLANMRMLDSVKKLPVTSKIRILHATLKRGDYLNRPYFANQKPINLDTEQP